MANKTVDWEKIQMEFRAGQISVRAIAHEYGITEGAVRKRAKRDNWERNLADRVLSRVRDEVRSTGDISEEEIVEAAAARSLEIINIHRKAADRQRETVERLSESVNKLMPEADMDTATLKELSIIARNLSGSLDTLISIERKAFGLGDKKEGDVEGKNILIIEDCDAHLKSWPREEGFLSDEP